MVVVYNDSVVAWSSAAVQKADLYYLSNNSG